MKKQLVEEIFGGISKVVEREGAVEVYFDRRDKSQKTREAIKKAIKKAEKKGIKMYKDAHQRSLGIYL